MFDFISSFWQETALCRKEFSAGGALCLVTNFKPGTVMLYSPLALAHLSNLLITHYLA